MPISVNIKFKIRIAIYNNEMTSVEVINFIDIFIRCFLEKKKKQYFPDWLLNICHL